MKAQFNLLPDVKQNYLKAQRTKRSVMTVAFIVTGVSLLIFIAMLSTVYVINKKQLSDAGKDVSRLSSELKSIPDIDKILSVQKQLGTLTSLHQGKHLGSRIFQYLPQVTPTNVNMGRLSINYTTNTMQINGTSDSQKTINTFIDTLKFTTYKIDGQDTKIKAFPSVIETSFGITDKGASYGLTIVFDPVLFSNSQKVELNVPSGLATTRSVLNDPKNALFDGQNAKPDESGQEAPR